MNIANLFSYAVGSKDEGKQFQMDLFAKYCALGRLKEAEKCLQLGGDELTMMKDFFYCYRIQFPGIVDYSQPNWFIKLSRHLCDNQVYYAKQHLEQTFHKNVPNGLELIKHFDKVQLEASKKDLITDNLKQFSIETQKQWKNTMYNIRRSCLNQGQKYIFEQLNEYKSQYQITKKYQKNSFEQEECCLAVLLAIQQIANGVTKETQSLLQLLRGPSLKYYLKKILSQTQHNILQQMQIEGILKKIDKYYEKCFIGNIDLSQMNSIEKINDFVTRSIENLNNMTTDSLLSSKLQEILLAIQSAFPDKCINKTMNIPTAIQIIQDCGLYMARLNLCK